MNELVVPFFLIFGMCAAVIQAGEASELPEWCRKLPRPAYAKLERILPDEPWFEVYKVSPGVFALCEPRQSQEVISFLISGKTRALLLDTGMGIASIRSVVSRLTSLPVIVLNTHTHADHVGGNHEFTEIWGMEGAYTQSNTKGISDPWVKEQVLPPNVCGSLPHAFQPEQYKIAPFKITHFIKDGDVIDLGDRKLEVISCPGHTPDSLCLHDVQNRLLFTGDTFYAGPIYLFVPETDMKAYERSVARMLALKNVDLLLPSHNEPVADPKVLPRLLEAARQVQSGVEKFEITEGHRKYLFDGFSMLRPN